MCAPDDGDVEDALTDYEAEAAREAQEEGGASSAESAEQPRRRPPPARSRYTGDAATVATALAPFDSTTYVRAKR